MVGRRFSATRTARLFAVAAISFMAVLAVCFSASPAAEAKKPKKDKGDLWFLGFSISYELEDSARWDFDIQEACGRDIGEGSQGIVAKVDAGGGALDVRRKGRRFYPDPSNKLYGWNDIGGEDAYGPASISLISNVDSQSFNGPDCPEPIICSDCNSGAPPQQACGTRSGTVYLKPTVDFSGTKGRIRLEDEWDPPDPFYQEGSATYCPGSRALWSWGYGFPATTNPEGDQVIEVDTRKLLGFTKLKDRQRASCGRVRQSPISGDWIEYWRSLCKGKDGKEPSFIKKADYSKTVKTIQIKEEKAPKRLSVSQTSRVKIKFKFQRLMTQSRWILENANK